MRIALLILYFIACALAKETLQDAARIARNLVDSQSIATLSTVFPSNSSLPGYPFGLIEYYAPCFSNGSLALILMGISKHAQHIAASPTHAATISVSAPLSRSPVAKPRVALTGHVTTLPNFVDERQALEACYLRSHPDSAWWIPGKGGFHDAAWARFDPSDIFFVGGFGGEHYIGTIPVAMYQTSEAAAIAYPSNAQHIAALDYDHSEYLV